jgi:hypothetical protein
MHRCRCQRLRALPAPAAAAEEGGAARINAPSPTAPRRAARPARRRNRWPLWFGFGVCDWRGVEKCAVTVFFCCFRSLPPPNTRTPKTCLVALEKLEPGGARDRAARGPRQRPQKRADVAVFGFGVFVTVSASGCLLYPATQKHTLSQPTTHQNVASTSSTTCSSPYADTASPAPPALTSSGARRRRRCCCCPLACAAAAAGEDGNDAGASARRRSSSTLSRARTIGGGNKARRPAEASTRRSAASIIVEGGMSAAACWWWAAIEEGFACSSSSSSAAAWACVWWRERGQGR